MRIKLLIPIIILIYSGFSIAADSPLPMLDDTAKQVISALEKKRQVLKKDPDIAYNIVRRFLLPHVDIYGMSRSVIGRKVWKEASLKQRRQFSEEFTKLVVRTYSSALTDYTNEKVKFFPVRGGYKNKRHVQVNSMIKRENGTDIPLSYSLILKKEEWKIYDMSVEGVSLLQSFRSQFAVELTQGSLEQLINKLKQHNERTL